MAQVIPARAVQRWYPVRWPGDRITGEMFAERFFDSWEDAYNYAERRRTEISPRRVNEPIRCREDASIWAVCIEVS
jgi:hypothetical protein